LNLKSYKASLTDKKKQKTTIIIGSKIIAKENNEEYRFTLRLPEKIKEKRIKRTKN